MEKLFTKFYGNHIKEIHDFLNSDTDILYINGFSGSGKSSVLKTAIKTYENDILKFHHLCFRGTVTDDFLLSYYDTFRNYALKGKIALKKNPEEGFMEKVSFYFNNLETPAVVIVDNFEAVTDEEEITDFLIHISKFENVKIIVISKNPSCALVENPTVSLERIFFDKINLFEFGETLESMTDNIDSSLIERLYEATDGYELYLKMALNYLDSIPLSLEEFLNEYKEKEIPFEEFIVNKQVSLIPDNYYPVLKNLAFINHNIPPLFIEAYELGDIKQLSYLLNKFMISEFWGSYYIKSYLRNYFTQNISLQDKVAVCNKLVSIYENELKKSPKDRILRLSRESIRKQIAFLNEITPKVAQINPNPSFSYVAHAISNNPSWFVTDDKKTMRAFDALKKKREEKKQKEAEEKIETPSLFETTMARALALDGEYQFREALDVLFEAKPLAENYVQKMNVYSKIARTALKLNNNNLALSTLRELCEICKNENDTDSFAKYRIEIGKIYKKIYAFARAKNCFEEIINKSSYISKKTEAEARLALGEIYELENNFENGVEQYKSAFDLILNSNGESDILLPEISYKLGALYDENGYFDEALIEYQNSIKYATISNNNLYLLKAYTNSGVILADSGETEDALNNLSRALELSNETGNYIDTYYIARNIAEIYKNTEPEKSYEYLNLALEYARLSGNSFEIAISLIELGDYYYDLKQNEQALICYFQAKTTLGASASKENTERVITRINDMKIKLGDYIFNGMKELYDR